MRLLAAGVVVAGAALFAVPLLAVRSSSNTDGLSDGGVDGGLARPLDGGAPQGTNLPPPSNGGILPERRDAGPRIEIREDGTQVIHVGDEIGVLHNSAPSDGGAPSAAPGPTVAELQLQISALQGQLQSMRQQQNLAQAQAEQMQQMNEQLRQLNAQVASRQAQRDDSSAQAAAQQAQTQHAIDGLGAAMDAMASGNGDVGSALDAADQSFTPQARRDLAAARDALANKNLDQARALVQTAIGDAQRGR